MSIFEDSVQYFYVKIIIWASRFAYFVCSRRAIRSITFAHFMRFGGSASIPLASSALITNYSFVNALNKFVL
jgi:hypothetical protein